MLILLGLQCPALSFTHSSSLGWRISWTEEPGRLQFLGSLRVGHYWATSLSLFTFITFMTRHIHNWASFLLWPSRFILSRAIINCPPLFPRSILDTFWLGVGEGAYFLVSHFFAFSYISWGGQEYWSGLPFPPPVDCFLSELFTVTHLFGVALHGIPHSFIELRRPLCNDKVVIPVFHSF